MSRNYKNTTIYQILECFRGICKWIYKEAEVKHFIYVYDFDGNPDPNAPRKLWIELSEKDGVWFTYKNGDIALEFHQQSNDVNQPFRYYMGPSRVESKGIYDQRDCFDLDEWMVDDLVSFIENWYEENKPIIRAKMRDNETKEDPLLVNKIEAISASF